MKKDTLQTIGIAAAIIAYLAPILSPAIAILFLFIDRLISFKISKANNGS